MWTGLTPTANMDLHACVSKALTVLCARSIFQTTLEKQSNLRELEIVCNRPF